MRKASNILSDLAQGKSVWGYLYSNEEVLSVCEKVGISPGFFSIDTGAGKHTYLLQESGKTINVDAKIKYYLLCAFPTYNLSLFDLYSLQATIPRLPSLSFHC